MQADPQAELIRVVKEHQTSLEIQTSLFEIMALRILNLEKEVERITKTLENH